MTTTALPTGTLACRACGVATDPDASSLPTLVLDVILQEGKLMRPPLPEGLGPRRPLGSVALSVCPDCERRYAEAEAAASGLPRLAARVGTPLALQLAAALHAIAVLGVRQPQQLPEADASALLRHLAAAGTSALWLARFVPVASRDASPGTCAPQPWALVPGPVRDELRAAYGRLCAERVNRDAAPVRIPPPDGLACVLCGVGAVTVPAARVAGAGGAGQLVGLWRHVVTTAYALGGPRSPELLRGYVCPQCSRAVDSEGSIGQGAAVRALSAHLRASSRPGLPPSAAGAFVPGWGGLSARERRRGRTMAPNAEPWEHVVIGPADDEPAPAPLLPGELLPL